jgi:molybdate transport system substrate-binding protein
MAVRSRLLLVSVPLAVALTGALAGCGSSSTGPGKDTGGPSSSGSSSSGATSLTGSITVYAAASLTDTFQAIADQFKAAHPGTKITLNFGGSSTLATQINNGAPADVFASAAPKNMDQVKGKNAPRTFASNKMEIAIPPSNPGHVSQLADLAKPGVKVALCDEAVPCGATAATVFKNAHLTVKPVTREADVRSTLAKVFTRAVDAGVVYVTDVKAAGTKVHGVTIPDNVNATTTYPIATIKDSKNAALASAFVAYVLSSDGQKVLTAAGFGPAS